MARITIFVLLASATFQAHCGVLDTYLVKNGELAPETENKEGGRRSVSQRPLTAHRRAWPGGRVDAHAVRTAICHGHGAFTRATAHLEAVLHNQRNRGSRCPVEDPERVHILARRTELLDTGIVLLLHRRIVVVVNTCDLFCTAAEQHIVLRLGNRKMHGVVGHGRRVARVLERVLFDPVTQVLWCRCPAVITLGSRWRPCGTSAMGSVSRRTMLAAEQLKRHKSSGR